MRVEVEDLPEEIRQAAPKPVAIEETVKPIELVEKAYILEVLEPNGGKPAARKGAGRESA